MSGFDATDKRLQRIQSRMPEFPFQKMRLLRMTNHLQRTLRDLNNAMLKPYDLVNPTYGVLAVLYGTEGESATASALSQACHEKPANLTRVCNELEARGLITRTTPPGDRRSVIITLSDDGRAMIEAALPSVWKKATRAYDGFSDEELQLLDRLYARQLDNLSRRD